MLAIDQVLSHSLILENDVVLVFGYSYILLWENLDVYVAYNETYNISILQCVCGL